MARTMRESVIFCENNEWSEIGLTYKMLLRVCGETGPFFGPGPARLFALVRAHRSLNKAAAAMDMAYSKAWRIVRNAEAATGETMLVRVRGGSEGGGSVLTPAAEELLARYTAFEAEMRRTGDRLFATYFPEEVAPQGDAGQRKPND